MDFSQIITPELIEMIVPMIAGGFSAYHGIKIGLYVLGKFLERRKAKKEAEEVEKTTKERRKIFRLLHAAQGIADLLVQAQAPKEQTEPVTPDAPEPIVVESDPKEIDLEEVIGLVVNSLKKK